MNDIFRCPSDFVSGRRPVRERDALRQAFLGLKSHRGTGWLDLLQSFADPDSSSEETSDQYLSLLLSDLLKPSFPKRHRLIFKIYYWALEENFPRYPAIFDLIRASREYHPGLLNNAALYYSALQERGNALGECGVSVFDEDDVVFVDNSFPDRLFVCFAGVGRRFLGLSWNVANEYFVKRSRANLLVLRDNFRLRYLKGVESLGMGGFSRSVVALRRLLADRFGSSEITFIGSSMGTYGALLYSSYVPCDRVVCLGGKTSLVATPNDLPDSDRAIDLRIRSLFRSPSFVSEYADPSSMLNVACNLRPEKSGCRYFYLCGKDHPSDLAAGHHLKAAVPDARLITYDTDRHVFMQEELEAGYLSAILA